MKKESNMKELYLLRGLPGAGKSTLAKSLGGKYIEADMFFIKDGVYKFDVTKLQDAHRWCLAIVGNWMVDNEKRIIVSNTFTQEWEMKNYYDWAKDFDYRVYSLIVENRHNGVNEHGVPQEKLEIMRDRFQIKLL
jgi:predicted kinase